MAEFSSARIVLGAFTLAALIAGNGAAAQSKQPIRIGVLTERSGVLGEMGVHNDMGVGLAVKEINAKGGIMGRPVEVIMADEQSDPTQAVNEARRLVEREKVDIIYGPIGSQTALAVLPILSEAKVTNISVAGSTAFTVKVAPYGFSTLPSAEAQGQQIVDFVVDQLKGKAVAILNDGGGQAVAAGNAMEAHLQKRGVKMTGRETYASGSDDMTPQLLNLKRGNPDQLILFAQAGKDTGRVLKNLAELGWSDIKVSGNISVGSGWTTVLPIAGPDAYKNVYSANYKVLTYCTNDPVGASAFAKWVADVKAFTPPAIFPKLSPLQVSYSYDAMYIIKAAIEGAKSTKGPDVTAWLEAGNKIPGKQGTYAASKASHFLQGPDTLVMVNRPDKARADDLVKREGC